jgi:hypothetical protein
VTLTQVTRSFTIWVLEDSIMGSKTFEGNVSIVLNTKGEIALKRDPEGGWDASKAQALHVKMGELAKKHKAKISSYALFQAEGGTEPVLLANRYGNPYVALLPKRGEGGATRKGVTKLA